MAKGSSGSFGGIANLYFPEAVNFSDGLVYDNASLGVAGELARKAAGGYSDLAGQIVNQNIGKTVAGLTAQAGEAATSVFRDVAVRTFSFSFLMSPQSEQESQSIENIIDFFRENAYPETILEGYGYKFPSKFFITFFYDGRKMSQAPKLLPCYLTSVNTVLNPRSSSFFEDGKANEVQLTMSFQEERALNKDDIKDGY